MADILDFLKDVKPSVGNNLNIAQDTREPKHLMNVITQAAESVNRRATKSTKLVISTYRVKLDIGDYTNGSIFVERKTTDDLLASIKDGRINEMIIKLSEINEALAKKGRSPIALVFMVSGTTKGMTDPEKKAISTTYAKLIRVGIQIVKLPNDFFLFHCMIRVFQFGIDSEFHYTIDRPKIDTSLNSSSTSVTLRMLLAIPYLRKDYAIRLADQFTIETLLSMTPNEITLELYEGEKPITMKDIKRPSKTALRIYESIRGGMDDGDPHLWEHDVKDDDIV